MSFIYRCLSLRHYLWDIRDEFDTRCMSHIFDIRCIPLKWTRASRANSVIQRISREECRDKSVSIDLIRQSVLGQSTMTWTAF